MDIKDTKEIESTEFNKWFGMGIRGRGLDKLSRMPSVQDWGTRWNYYYNTDGGGLGKGELVIF